MVQGSGRFFVAATLAAFIAACGPQEGLQETPDELQSSAQELSNGKKRNQLMAFAARPNMPHGAAGDRDVVFIAEPMAQRVSVLDRDSGQEIASLPAPAGGFRLPFAVRVPREGRVVLLDAGGFPDPSVPAIPRVFDYDYKVNERTGAFSATLVRTVDFSGLPVVFTEDIEVTSRGFYVVSEAVIGALWVIDQNGAISPGIFPDNPFEPLPQLGPCYFPDTVVDGIPFHPAGNFGPGVGFMTELEGDLYFSGVCPGGLHRVPLETLRDTSRTPGQRAADIQVVSPKQPGRVDAFHGLAVNKWDRNDRNIYAADSFGTRLLKINPDTGARTELAKDSILLNFPVSAQFLPPKNGNQPNPLLLVSDQEHRWTALNAALSQDLFTSPFYVTAVYPR